MQEQIFRPANEPDSPTSSRNRRLLRFLSASASTNVQPQGGSGYDCAVDPALGTSMEMRGRSSVARPCREQAFRPIKASYQATPGLSACRYCQPAASPERVGRQAPPPPASALLKSRLKRFDRDGIAAGCAYPDCEVRPGSRGSSKFSQEACQEGDVLYRIDPEPFRVQLQSAQATLERAKAVQLQARQLADRQRELRQRQVTSAQQFDDAIAQLAQADADVAAAEAGLAAAQLNLDYAEVKAPISGRIGRALVTEGALVVANGPENLATIQQLDPVYVDFTQSVNEMLELRRLLAAGALSSAGPDEARILLHYDDGSAYRHPGRLLFSESTVDPTTGQVTLRGAFPNPEGELLPGMYVRVRLEQGVRQNALAVPQQAVQRDPAGRAQVYVVKDDDTTEIRSVRLGPVVDNRWIVDEGLEVGDRVVVEGFQKIRPGSPVIASDWTLADKSEAAEGEPAPLK